jgi:hypothetical protein
VTSLFRKDPADVLDYKFDFKALTNGTGTSDFLGAGETILTRVVTLSDPGLVKDSDSITDSATSVTIWLSAGVAGIRYTVACKITTSAARTLERSMTISCLDQ